ncbi:hypothetical protein [Leptothermofonsia sp. ETS-13]|uniref:hypothetical protein n=1 Tax=Leptothermofonsia sp. ETS-13 TaxID=3035696 RepID=UPI003BA27897
MRDIGDRNLSSVASDNSPNHKRLGGYLVEAGLLTPAQVDVALNDQKLTGMRFGEILAARGWVKQQTIEYLMKKIVLPEQEAARREEANALRQEGAITRPSSAVSTINPSPHLDSGNSSSSPSENPRQTPVRRAVPISKPLPSVSSSDGDVSWVG